MVAVFVVSPVLAIKGARYGDGFIQLFSAALFAWDLWWLVAKPARAKL